MHPNSAPDNNNTTLRISVSWGGPESSKSIVLSHSTVMTAPYGYMGGMMSSNSYRGAQQYWGDAAHNDQGSTAVRGKEDI
ncbi:hypothetical protein E2C01_022114 [Portunus trituberculatus]|uniref:Uncharacterized protein n=1 Tax=Portunus trituberculatus TaxID=210409 RepID=A0A5B7E4D9_PORTR|nr:hypothetical protein [Portunus trituberculatus]